MVIDCTTFNGEHELFEIRYNILKEFVDEFRVIEFDQTFSGKIKPIYGILFTQEDYIKERYPKVKYYFVGEDTWTKYDDLAKTSPNTQYGKGAEHWVREFCMKESIKDCLIDLKDDDIVFVGDVDEIPDLNIKWQDFTGSPFKLRLKVYSYWLNNRSSEEFWGTLVSKYWHIKTDCLNHLRTNSWKTNFDAGWHFTSMGGHENVKKKLTDSYTKDSYANDWVLSNLQDNISNNKDFLGREFTYKIDESEWPNYLKDNKFKYKHLLRP